MDLFLVLDIFFSCIYCREAFSNWDGRAGESKGYGG